MGALWGGLRCPFWGGSVSISALEQNPEHPLTVASDADREALVWSQAISCNSNIWLAWAEEQYRLSRNSREPFRGQISFSSSHVSFFSWVELDFCSTGNGKLCAEGREGSSNTACAGAQTLPGLGSLRSSWVPMQIAFNPFGACTGEAQSKLAQPIQLLPVLSRQMGCTALTVVPKPTQQCTQGDAAMVPPSSPARRGHLDRAKHLEWVGRSCICTPNRRLEATPSLLGVWCSEDT